MVAPRQGDGAQSEGVESSGGSEPSIASVGPEDLDERGVYESGSDSDARRGGNALELAGINLGGLGLNFHDEPLPAHLGRLGAAPREEERRRFEQEQRLEDDEEDPELDINEFLR